MKTLVVVIFYLYCLQNNEDTTKRADRRVHDPGQPRFCLPVSRFCPCSHFDSHSQILSITKGLLGGSHVHTIHPKIKSIALQSYHGIAKHQPLITDTPKALFNIHNWTHNYVLCPSEMHYLGVTSTATGRSIINANFRGTTIPSGARCAGWALLRRINGRRGRSGGWRGRWGA